MLTHKIKKIMLRSFHKSDVLKDDNFSYFVETACTLCVKYDSIHQD